MPTVTENLSHAAAEVIKHLVQVKSLSLLLH